jgi:hypothetical protein
MDGSYKICGGGPEHFWYSTQAELARLLVPIKPPDSDAEE